jgi:hypothetical protein
VRARASLIVAVAAALWALAGAAPAGATAPLPPAELHANDGSQAWYPDRTFDVRWTNPTTGSQPTSFHYRLIGESRTLREEEVHSANTYLSVSVPWPEAFSLEVWLENAAGEEGVAAKTTLRYDGFRPPDIDPPQLPSWIGHNEFPFTVHLGALRGSPPLSGIRGYAVTIGPVRNDMPCAAVDRCTDAETTLRQGTGGNALTVLSLPEGTSYLSAVAVSGSGMKSVNAASGVLRVDLTDPVTQLAGAPEGWVSHPVRLTATATDEASGLGGGFTAIRVDDGAPVTEWGSSATTTVIGEGAHTVAYYARDTAGNTDDGNAGNRQPRTAMVRIDRGEPSIAFANSQSPRDPDLIRVRIADPLSGPDPSRGSIGVRAAGSGDRFEPLPPAPPGAGELRARWDSDSYPVGEYEFSATAYDGAGNSATTTRRADGSAMVLSNPLRATTTLLAHFDGGAPTQRLVPYGKGAGIRGRLTTGIDTPLEGMPLRIVERFAPGPGPAKRVSVVRTEPGGTFSASLAPGPSREVTVLFDGSTMLARSAGPPLELQVRSGVSLTASAASAKVGGAPVVFRGKVAAGKGEIPAGGESVEMQFKLPGLPWTEFHTVKTNRRGRFRYAYRFSDDDSRGVRFQFRAYVPEQENWPYEPGGSRPVLVRGR